MVPRWGDIKKAAQLGSVDAAILAVCGIEEKRGVVFLRVPVGLTFPPLLWNRLADACKAKGLTLKKTGKWPAVDDLRNAVSDLDWLWRGWIPKGFLTMLAGAPGTGKSTLAHHFIKVVVTGGCWPDGSKQKQHLAVIVETESAQVLLVKHFRDMGIPMNRVYMPGFDGDMMGQPDLAKPEHQDRLRALCEEKRPALVVLDSIGGAHTKGENRIEDIRPMMEFLATLARDHDCATLAVHHLKKRADGFEEAALTVNDVRGSSAITAFTRSLLGLSKKNGALQLEVVKSNVAAIGEPLSVKFETNEKGDVIGVKFGKVEPVKTAPTAVDQCADWIRATLAAEGKQSAKTITEWGNAAGFTRGTLFRAAEKLEEEGELVRTGRGKATMWELFKIPSAEK